MGDKVLYFAYASCMFKQRLNKSSATLKTIAKLEVGPFLRITFYYLVRATEFSRNTKSWQGWQLGIASILKIIKIEKSVTLM